MDGDTTQQQESNNSTTSTSDVFHFEERLNAIGKKVANLKNGTLQLPTDIANKDEKEREKEKQW